MYGWVDLYGWVSVWVHKCMGRWSNTSVGGTLHGWMDVCMGGWVVDGSYVY